MYLHWVKHYNLSFIYYLYTFKSFNLKELITCNASKLNQHKQFSYFVIESYHFILNCQDYRLQNLHEQHNKRLLFATNKSGH